MRSSHKKYTEKNRAAWNEVIPKHKKAWGDSIIADLSRPDYVGFDVQEVSKLKEYDISGKKVAHICCNNGIETLLLKKLGAASCVGFDISDAAIAEAIILSKSVQIPATFIRTDVYDISSLVYEWNFGDGSVGYGINPIHVYSNAGTYSVTLTVTDNDGATSTDTLVITVNNLAPTAALAGPDRIIYGASISIEFIGVGYDTFSDVLGLVYNWNFGDGNPGTGKITSHIYTVASTYTVTLTVTDDNDAVVTDTCTVSVGIDSDGDNLVDTFETGIGTDVDNWDSDTDYISDYWEIYTSDTDPSLSDTDNDGLIDWYEIAYLGYDVDVDDDGLMCPRDWDSDGDWIKDGDDPNPLMYNYADGTEASGPVVISVNEYLGVYVVIEYEGVSTVKANIVEITPIKELNIAVGHYVDISTTSTVPFTAEIRFKYSMPLPPPTLEEQLALYQWHGANNKWIIEENTVVDVDKDFVWSKVTHFCELCIGNSNLQYSDNDGLCDWYERNTYHPNFSDDLAYLNGKTNELIDDTDGDGLWDGWGDLNGDGIFNGGETKGEVQYYTSPLNADTDDDNVPDDLDMDPLVDLTITVKITEILALDDVDDDILGNHNPADFYLWISCSNGQIAKLPDLADRDYFEENNDHVHPDSSAMFDAADDVEIIGFNIMLYDDDGGVEETYEDTLASGDDLCDLNYKQGTGGSGYILQINYNLKTGQWGMDDYPCDPNGYGHVSGEEDLYDGDQDDCELWFDITQNDYDADGLTWWQECGPDNPDRYGTDPTDWDTDGDGLNDYDEIIVYGINPIDSDIDDDGILDGMDLFMPPEWGLKSEVIITWPYIAPSMFPMTKDIIREAVIALNGKGVVRINIPDSAMEAMAKHILTNGPNSISIEAFDNGLIDFFSNPSGGGLWVRDYGPQFVINKNDNRVTVVDWKYGSSSYNPYPQDYYNEFHTVFGLDYINAEDIILDGGAFQTDGNGYGYVYGSYLTEFEKGILKNIHGLKEIREVPTFNSGTNHIDMYVYIASPTTVIIADFINGPVVDDNQVEAAIVAFESWGFEVIRLATPPPSPYYFAYTNALVINDRVLVPTYNMPWWDENAISVFQNAFPLKKIVPIHAETGLQYSGAVHCAAITKPLMP